MRSRFLSVVIFLTAILQVTSQVTVAQISLQTHNAIRARYDAADFTGTESLLREVLSKQPELFARNNYDYLLARVYESQGKLTEAREVYRQVISRKSVLSAYATWHLAELARSQGNSGEEQEYLKQLLGQSGDFLNVDSARTRLGTSLYRSRKYSEAIDILRPQAGLSGARSRESLARIGEAQLALGQDSAARGTMESLVGGSRDDAALRGIAALDRMDFQARAKLTEAEHLRRARIYQFNRAFAEARNHWLEIIKQFPVSSNRAEAAWETGRGFQWEDKFREAIPYFQMAYDANPKSDEGEQGFYYVGHCYQYLNEDRPAIARYTDFIRIYPQSKFLGYAYLNAIDTLRAVGKDAEALSWAQRAQTEVKDPFIQVTGLFQQARIHLSMGDFAAALNDFNSLKGRNLSVRGLVAGPNQAEASFMVAYCLEQLGRTTEAISAYLGFVESRSGASGYYGMRATMRLRALQANSKTSAVVKAKAEDFARQAREAGKAGDHNPGAG